ncbi:MAG: hypothetical protein M0Q38_16940 [Bacteroidales bacterium]|nr:hypothetical protein [Bacteroidales bacterium]
MQDARYRMQDAGCWILDVGYWMQDTHQLIISSTHHLAISLIRPENSIFQATD